MELGAGAEECGQVMWRIRGDRRKRPCLGQLLQLLLLSAAVLCVTQAKPRVPPACQEADRSLSPTPDLKQWTSAVE